MGQLCDYLTHTQVKQGSHQDIAHGKEKRGKKQRRSHFMLQGLMHPPPLDSWAHYTQSASWKSHCPPSEGGLISPLHRFSWYIAFKLLKIYFLSLHYDELFLFLFSFNDLFPFRRQMVQMWARMNMSLRSQQYIQMRWRRLIWHTIQSNIPFVTVVIDTFAAIIWQISAVHFMISSHNIFHKTDLSLSLFFLEENLPQA